MTASGENGERRRWHAGLAAIAGAALLFFGGVEQALSLSPPRPLKSELVLESGGRIVSIDADGNNRRILTRPGPGGQPFMAGATTRPEDLTPSISPDGSKLLYRGEAYSRKLNSTVETIEVANRDGSEPRVIARFDGAFLNDLAWDPSGRSVVYSQMSFRKQGTYDEVTIFSFRRLEIGKKKPAVLFKHSFGPKTSDSFGYQQRWLTGFRLDPSGRTLAFEFLDRKEGRMSIQLRDLNSGKTRTLVPKGIEPAFSPDGETVYFADPTRFDRFSDCDEKRCGPGGIHRVPTAGGKPKRILKLAGSAASLAVSPDGTRIAFESNRNFPVMGGEDTFEVYSISTDGSCLTWLTNGSPGSHSPAWAPGIETDPAPSVCGQYDRQPLVEYHPRKSPPGGPGPHLWAGREFGGRLLSAPPPSMWDAFEYGDCGYFDRRDCHQQIAIDPSNQCSHFASEIEYGPVSGTVERRGVLVARTRLKGKPEGSMVTTGRLDVYIGRMFWFRNLPWARPASFADHLEAVDALRPLPREDASTGDLPAGKITTRAAAYLRQAERAFARTGSIRKTAKIVDSRPRWVRADLTWYRGYRKLGPYETFRCPWYDEK